MLEFSVVAGANPVGKLFDMVTLTRGCDARSGQYVDMFKASIIDPTKVVRTALQDAGSVAAVLVTTAAMVAEKPKKEEPMPGGGPGMGDMGGMM